MIAHSARRTGVFISCLAGLTIAASGMPAAAAASAPRDANSGARPYWVYLRFAPEVQKQVGAVALAPRAVRRLARLGRAAGADPRDHAITDAALAPLRERGIAVRRRSRFLNAASALLSPEQKDALASDPRIERIAPVARFIRPLEPGAPAIPRSIDAGTAPSAAKGSDPSSTDPRSLAATDYGAAWEQLEMLGIPELHHRGYSGRGVMVALFDTGFYEIHTSLASLDLAAERDFVCGDGDVQFDAGSPCDVPQMDDHGTLTWSALGGFAPGRHLGAAYRATFALARTEDVAREVHMEEDNYIAALEWADSLGVEIISTSLGYRFFDDGGGYPLSDLDGETLPITRATEIAAERGMLVVTAMGNDGPEPSTLIAPADGKNVLSVGAVDFAGAVAAFSSRGPTGDGRIKPDVLAHGVGTSCANPASPNTYTRASGTSLATPLMAGLAALLLEARPELSPDSLIARLRAAGDRAGNPTNDSGWGVPDGLRALRIGDARPRIARVAWIEAGGTAAGTADWGETGRVALWIRNDGAVVFPAGSLIPEAHDAGLAVLDTTAVALEPLDPGAADSVSIPVRIEPGEGFDLKGLFVRIEAGSGSVERKALLPITRPYTLERFDVAAGAAGTARISWQILPDLPPEALFGSGLRLIREDESGARTILTDVRDGWTGEWVDRPGTPGLYRYSLEIQMLVGLYVAEEGPKEAFLSPPGRPAIDAAYPNPVPRGSLSIPIAWTAAGSPRLDVYDVAGRRVRTLSAGAFAPGFPILTWDLTDEDGRAVASGIYFLRLEGGGSARVAVTR